MDGQSDPRDNELVAITRGSAKLALSTLRAQNQQDFYHNYGAAEKEIGDAIKTADEMYEFLKYESQKKPV